MANRKLVLDEKDGSVLIGVSAKDCDPVVRTVEGDLEAALEKVAAILMTAQETWTQSPRNPTYTPPKTPSRARTTPATAQEATATSDLPLLSGTGPASAPKIPVSEAKATEDPTPVTTTERTEAQTEEPAEEVTVATAPETAEAPATFEKPAGQWEYMLKDGRGPYPDIQAAIDDMGMDVQDRPHHNRWDRLSAQLKEQVLRRPKQS